jgi:hypothetical protein
MQFLRQVLVQDASLTASTSRSDDLPVNPLSVIMVTVKALNDTGTLTDYNALTGLLGFVSKLEVTYQGSAVISGSLADLARVSALITGRGPRQLDMSNTNNNIRGIMVPIVLGRRPYWAKECFPAVRRGELKLLSTFGAAPTGLDTFVYQIETVELLGATPSHYLKYTTISKTPSATGDHDVDLPIGNLLAGVTMFGTTAPTGASFNASLGQVKLLVDNVEAYYSQTNWESLNGDLQLRAQGNEHSNQHTHASDLAAAYTQFQQTDEQENQLDFFNNYAHLDLDPLQDDNWLLDTRGRARINLRINADVADAIRLLPWEIVPVAAS